MHIQLDTIGGIAGDMFIAAAIDAWPEHIDGMLTAIQATGIPPHWRIHAQTHSDSILRGKRFAVECDAIPVRSPSDTGQGPHHAHETLTSIVQRLDAARLDPGVRRRAIAIFDLLGRAEAWVHGVSLDEVAFHELSEWDSIVDVVGAAYLIEALKPSSWSVGPIPLGSGRVRTAHGQLPIPAPATVRLLEGFTLIDDGVQGERVTPTGAAILRYLRDILGTPGQWRFQPMTLARTGTGFGSRSLPGLSNALRIICFDVSADHPVADRVGVIEFEIDDQSAEDLALGLDVLRSHPGVIDVLQVPAFGKKGRMAVHVQILARPELLAEIIESCFAETATIGLRWSVCARAKLARTSTRVDVDGAAVAVKITTRPYGLRSAKAEIEAVRESGTRVERQRKRSEAESIALRSTGLDES